MRTTRFARSFGPMVAASVGLLLLVWGCGAGPESEDALSEDRAVSALSQVAQHPHKALCPRPNRPGERYCHARVRTDEQGLVPFLAGPSGLNPTDLRSAYALPSSGGSGKTVAIVDAQDDPNAEKDLGTYRTQFGLPACTTANGCFKKVNQNGAASPLPKADAGWAGEIALDLDMVSAACPDCKLLLVEANSATDADLKAAELTAVSLGASVISNSWGGDEDSTIAAGDAAWFNHPGVAITVSAGDSGYGAEYPATSQYVTAVGGTSLVKGSGARGWTETVWGTKKNTDGGTGSGCSKYITKPSWQKDTGCAKRTVADVAAVADPNTGVSVYDSYGGSGWAVYGGTSAAAPLVAGIFAITGNGKATGSLSYSKPTAFYDVVAGVNGSCTPTYLCNAAAGYDGPTGNGSPNGSVLKSSGTCTASCVGKSCGDDGCGGSCGSCASGTTCSSAGTCTGSSSTCAHAICVAGKKLTDGCDACVTKICAADDYCCSGSWDSVCVSEVSELCGQTC